jgi:hypothetical protein
LPVRGQRCIAGWWRRSSERTRGCDIGCVAGRVPGCGQPNSTTSSGTVSDLLGNPLGSTPKLDEESRNVAAILRGQPPEPRCVFRG